MKWLISYNFSSRGLPCGYLENWSSSPGRDGILKFTVILLSRMSGVPTFFKIFHCESHSYNHSLLVSSGKGKELSVFRSFHSAKPYINFISSRNFYVHHFLGIVLRGFFNWVVGSKATSTIRCMSLNYLGNHTSLVFVHLCRASSSSNQSTQNCSR